MDGSGSAVFRGSDADGCVCCSLCMQACACTEHERDGFSARYDCMCFIIDNRGSFCWFNEDVLGEFTCTRSHIQCACIKSVYAASSGVGDSPEA